MRAKQSKNETLKLKKLKIKLKNKNSHRFSICRARRENFHKNRKIFMVKDFFPMPPTTSSEKLSVMLVKASHENGIEARKSRGEHKKIIEKNYRRRKFSFFDLIARNFGQFHFHKFFFNNFIWKRKN